MNQPNIEYVNLLKQSIDDLHEDKTCELTMTIKKNRQQQESFTLRWYKTNMENFWMPRVERVQPLSGRRV